MDHRLCPYWLSWMYSGRCKRKYVVFRSNSSNIHTLIVCLLMGCVVTGVSWMLRKAMQKQQLSFDPIYTNIILCLLAGCVVTGLSWMLREPPVVSSRPPSASWLLGNPHPRCCTPQKTTGFQSSTRCCTGCTRATSTVHGQFLTLYLSDRTRF